MWKVLYYALCQSLLLAGGQVFLKFAMAKIKPFGWNWDSWASLLSNWQFAASGVFFGASSILWMYIIKHYPLSVAYPMISLSYVFGMISAIVFFHEEVSLVKWTGVVLIMAGCCLIAK